VSLCLEGDTVTAITWLRGMHWSILLHPDRDLLYVGSSDPGLRAIDCRTDSITRTFDEIGSVMDIRRDTARGRDRLYIVAGPTYGIPSLVYTVDCATQTLGPGRPTGRRLTRALPAPGRDRLWVADGEGSAVAVLDGATLDELARLGVGARVSALAWNSIDRRLYTANARTTNISVIDGNSLTVIDTISVGYNPFDMLWVPELNKLYVTSQLECRIHVIDCATSQVVADLPGRGRLNHLAHSRTSNKVYCSVYEVPGQLDSSVVIVIDGSTNEVLTEIWTPRNTTRLLWYPDSNWMYCTRFRSLTVIDCETDRIMSTITGLRGPTEMVFNPRNNSIYVAHGSHQGPPYEILVIDAPTRQIRKRLSLDGWPYPMAWNSEKNELYAGAPEEGKVYVIDCETDSIAAAITTPDPGERYLVDVVWNYVENKLYCSDIITNSVYIVDVATRRVTHQLPVRSWPLEMAWDPVANRTYVPAWDGSNATVLRGGPPGVAGPAGAPVISRPAGPTIVRGVLSLPGTASGERSAVSALLDVTGRKVMDLLPGDNDVRHLAPGVYFVGGRGSSGKVTAGPGAKVLIQR
jgi:YVTN family beta-propeller protein